MKKKIIMTYGLVKVAAAIPKVKVCDVDYNLSSIIELCEKAYQEEVEVVVFPELCLTGYTCGDLFHQSELLYKATKGLHKLTVWSSGKKMHIIVGAPLTYEGKLTNRAFIISSGQIIGHVGKKILPGYKEFYEPRWFSPDTEQPQVFDTGSFKYGVEICEDLWSPEPPSTALVKGGADMIFNLSASNELVGKHEYLMELLKQQSARLLCGYIYSSSGYGESSTDLVFAGNGVILENGNVLRKSDRFVMDPQLVISEIDIESLRNERMVNTSFRSFVQEDTAKHLKITTIGQSIGEYYSKITRTWNGHPFKVNESKYYEVLEIQSHALAKRLEHTGMKAILGISGGSDSTWAAIVVKEALKKLGRPSTDSIGVTMPGFATSERTYQNSKALMELLGMAPMEVDIKEMCTAELKALGHPLGVQDITYENVQARTRTQILMNLANQEGALVIGTGDMSELALGWCTYNADHMSMYGVNSSVPKTMIKDLIRIWGNGNEVIEDILSTPVSPELTGTGADGTNAQTTESLIGPYELHDFFLYHTLRHGFGPGKIKFLALHSDLDYTEEEIEKWMDIFYNRFFKQQFKRSCLPDGPKIGSVSLSPRGDWRMPSDACVWKQ